MAENTLKIHTCYTADIRKQLLPNGDAVPVEDSIMSRTAEVCLRALRFCTNAFIEQWDSLSMLKGVLRKRQAEVLIHSTVNSSAMYTEFDRKFPNMPSGMRRAIISDALGMVSAYRSNHQNWESLSPEERGNEPVIGLPNRYELTFYDQERDISCVADGKIRLKLFDGKDWKWYSFLMKPSDIRYISRIAAAKRMLSPTIIKVHGKYRIRFCFEEKKQLVSNDNPLNYRILAVDLGINAAGTWCVMEKDGTVHARGVIHTRAEEGRLRHYINRVRQYQQSGKHSNCVYRWLKAANRVLSIETARQIILAAEMYNVDCIAFEHLDTSGKKHGRMKARLHHWHAMDVQRRVETKAHQDGMRVSRVCAWNTSKLAFDGSGTVSRGVHSNYSVCRFTYGKIYNCDLSASYNIGARFFLREYMKLYPNIDLPKTPWRTYSHLINIYYLQVAFAA